MIPFKRRIICLCYVIGSQMKGGGEGGHPEQPSLLFCSNQMNNVLSMLQLIIETHVHALA